jgi:BASS family bile acid:Na+ symporter
MHTQPPDRDQSIRTGDRLARFVERHFLWLLVGCYVLATLWPQPGLVMKQWEWSPGTLANQPLTLSLLLLAVMLLIAAMLTDLQRIRSIFQNPLLLCLALVAVWLGPALLVVVAGWVVPWAVGGQATVGLLVGLALVAAMPVANSSVGWTQSAAGNLALGLALVVISISLSPWATPHLLSWLGMSLSPAERAYCEQLVTNFSGLFFIVWVLLPTAAGFACRYLATPQRVAAAENWLALTSAAALLILNYINSALALPKVRESSPSLLVATAVLAAALSVVGLVCGWAIARLLRLPGETRSALMFGLSMKHTGLALILAGAVLHGQPLATLMIVLATLMQHLLAGLVHWRLQHLDFRVARP